MEEIDSIIICTLKEIGCELSESETSLENIAQETFIKAIVLCLQKIEPTISLSHTIPKSMSARYQYGITVADACKKVGYKSDIGYQTVLYGNIVDVRRILMFLIEKLPKETKNIIENKSKRCTIIKVLKDSYSSDRKTLNSSLLTSYPFVSVALETGITVPGHKRNCTPAEWRNFCVNSLKYITEQPSDLKHLIPSLITLNSNRLLNIYNSEPKAADDLPQSKVTHETVETSTLKSTVNLNLDEKIHSVSNKPKESEMTYIEELISKNSELKNLILKQRSSKVNLTTKLEKLEKESTVQEKSFTIVNNPEIIVKLKNKVNAAPEKIKKMNNKWIKYENEQKLILSKLVEETNKKREINNKLEMEFGNEKFKLQSIFDEIKKKEEIIKIGRLNLDSNSNYNSRSSYTERILEIISNIKKQKKEINKSLDDTRLVQKEINSLDGKVERCFISIDELMFKVAKKDDNIRKCYKLLAAIHSNSSNIITSVKQTGTIEREIKDLEEQIENENSRHTSANIQKLKKDLELVKNEQILLLKKIENITNQTTN